LATPKPASVQNGVGYVGEISVNFELFCGAFSPDERGVDAAPWLDDRLRSIDGYVSLAERFAGQSFDDGVYWFHSSVTGLAGQESVAVGYPELADRVCVFAYDWLGRQFAVDFGQSVADTERILQLEPGTGDTIEIPVTFRDFHESELVQHREDVLASGYFAQWKASRGGNAGLSPGQCVGYKIPLFLGGQDAIENLEVSDFDVYWCLMGQLLAKTSSLPEGTRITQVTIDD
jgi:hypothetical protein